MTPPPGGQYGNSTSSPLCAQNSSADCHQVPREFPARKFWRWKCSFLCGAATAVGSPLPSSQEPEAPRVLNPGIRNFCTASVETSESRCPAPGLEALRYPAPPPGGAGGPRHQSPEGPWRPSVPQPCLEDSGPGTTDSLQQSPGARAQDLWVGGTWGWALQSPSAALWGCSIHHFEGTLELGSPTLPPLV